jgi:hypothetical protein
MDRDNAGAAWDGAAYPTDLTLTVGVAKERNANGAVLYDASDNPQYVVNFTEYHVSEKLSDLLRERAIKRIDDSLADTITTAMSYIVEELTDSMLTFLGELSNRTKVFPSKTDKDFGDLYDAEIIRRERHEDNAKVPQGHLRVLIRRDREEGGKKQKVLEWYGPIKEGEFVTRLRPQVTGERKKIYPSVIAGLVEQMEAFKNKKAQMLGAYGDNIVGAFGPLLETLLKAKEHNSWLSNQKAVDQLADVLRSDTEVREIVSQQITDTIERLEAQVETVKVRQRRRSIKVGLAGVTEHGEAD